MSADKYWPCKQLLRDKLAAGVVRSKELQAITTRQVGGGGGVRHGAVKFGRLRVKTHARKCQAKPQQDFDLFTYAESVTTPPSLQGFARCKWSQGPCWLDDET